MFGKTAKMGFVGCSEQQAGKVWERSIPSTWTPCERPCHTLMCHLTTTAFTKALLGNNAGFSHKIVNLTPCLKAAKQLSQGFCGLCLGVLLVLVKERLKKYACYRKLRVSLWWHSYLCIAQHCHKEHLWNQKALSWQEIWAGHKITSSGLCPFHEDKLQLPSWEVCKPSSVIRLSPTYFEGEKNDITQVNCKHWKSRKCRSKVMVPTKALYLISDHREDLVVFCFGV